MIRDISTVKDAGLGIELESIVFSRSESKATLEASERSIHCDFLRLAEALGYASPQPLSDYEGWEQARGIGPTESTHPLAAYMTLHDIYAGQAMAMIMQCVANGGWNNLTDDRIEGFAKEARRIADAMMRART